MANSDNTHAVVIRLVEFSETSLIVTLLTRDLGRVSAIAKGARRAKGPFEGALDLLSVCRVGVIQKSSDALDLLTEAKLRRRFRGGEQSLARLHAGYHVAEMLRLLMTDDHEPHPDVYDLTIDMLQRIDRRDVVADDESALAAALLHFDVQLLGRLGLAPGTDRCTDCGGAIEPTRGQPFSLDAGGVVCENCRSRQAQTISVDVAAMATLRRLQAESLRSDDGLEPAVYGSLRPLINRYVQTVVGRVPRMQRFLPGRLMPNH